MMGVHQCVFYRKERFVQQLRHHFQWGPGTKISPGGATVIRNRKFAPYWRSPLRQLLRICFVQMNISHGPFPNCERSWEEGMCACREEKKTSSPGKMHVLRTHFSTSRHTTLRQFHCIKMNAEDSLLRFHKVKPVGLSKLPVPLTVAPPGESAIVPGPHWRSQSWIYLYCVQTAHRAAMLVKALGRFLWRIRCEGWRCKEISIMCCSAFSSDYCFAPSTSKHTAPLHTSFWQGEGCARVPNTWHPFLRIQIITAWRYGILEYNLKNLLVKAEGSFQWLMKGLNFCCKRLQGERNIFEVMIWILHETIPQTTRR